jgi:transcriptional regulator with XRE-family HTH domain
MADNEMVDDDESAPTEADQLRGEYLRALRVERGFERQQDLAEAAGIPQGLISRYEAGQRMRRGNAEKLAKVLGVSVDRLIGELDFGIRALDEIGADPFPNRRRLRKLPEFRAMPAEVQHRIVHRPQLDHDLGYFEWIDDLRMYLVLFQRGELTNERGNVPVPLMDETVDRLSRGLIPPPRPPKKKD